MTTRTGATRSGTTSSGATSTIERKALMAATGLTLLGWTLLHMGGNLLVFAGANTLNHYAAVLQGSPLLWGMRLALVVVVSVHIRQAWATWRLARRAQGRDHPHRRRRFRRSTVSARAIRAGGVAILLFVIYHVLHIYGVAHHDFVANDVYHNVVAGFRRPLVSAVYVLATVAFCSHVHHGVLSAARSMGVRAQPGRLGRVALYVAVALGVGFTAPCFAVWMGLLR